VTNPAQLQPLVNQLKQGGIEDPFAAAYQEPSGRNVVIWGGTGSIFGIGTPQSRLDGFFAGAEGQFNGAKASGRSSADTGSAGGQAACETVSGTGVSLAICAWAGRDAVLGLIFTGYQRATADSLMPTVLSAVVKS
jgi:hypothetical protein